MTATVLCIAHRGARSLAPENTLPAAQKAIAVGADMWELDVSVSRDGQLLLLHDDTLNRTTNAARLFPDRAPWRVVDFTAAEVARLDAGSWFEQQDPFQTIAAGQVDAAALPAIRAAKIPTLAEALAFTKAHHWRANIEIKPLSPPLQDFPVAEKVAALVDDLGLAAQVTISSFDWQLLAQVRHVAPHLVLEALVAPFNRWPTLNEMEAGGFSGLNPHYSLLRPEPVAQFLAHGLNVTPWTVNEPAQMKRCLALGVSGIITDFPQRLRPLLA